MGTTGRVSDTSVLPPWAEFHDRTVTGRLSLTDVHGFIPRSADQGQSQKHAEGDDHWHHSCCPLFSSENDIHLGLGIILDDPFHFMPAPGELLDDQLDRPTIKVPHRPEAKVGTGSEQRNDGTGARWGGNAPTRGLRDAVPQVE
jgi:hypothetical protein